MQQNLPLTMIRTTLDNLPQYELPAGYALRWYQPGDEQHWVHIHALADRYNTISAQLYQREFGSDPAALDERQCFLLDAAGAPIGTATAWYNKSFQGRPYGRVHWVAIVPELHGRGLAKPLMAVICRRLRELGHDRAYLETSTARIPAVSLYLKFGFMPQLDGAVEEARWREVISRLQEERRSS